MITDTGVHAVALALQLKSIGLSCDQLVTDKSLKHLIHCATTLNALHIAQASRSSNLSMDASMVDASLETLNTFRSVGRLICFYSSISNNAFDKGPLDLPHLRKLTICSDDAALTTIVNNCPAIAHWDLSKSLLITDESIFSVATKLKLKTVSLPCNYRLTNKSLEHLSHSADTLQALHIEQNMSNGAYPNKMTLSAVRTLLSKTKNCQYTWSVSIHEGECNLQACANATTISIDRPLTDSLLEEIAQHCTSLRVLDLYLSSKHVDSQYTSVGLSAVINGCTMLEIISIREDLNMPHLDEVIRQHTKLFIRSFVNRYDVEKMN
eukprot:gene11903-13806_t